MIDLQTNNALDLDRLGKVIARAITAIDQNGGITSGDKFRWINAIAKASVRLHDPQFLMTWQPEAKTLLIWTVGSTNQVYEANGNCQCKAYAAGNPCWHRAAARLVKNYLEADTVTGPAQLQDEQTKNCTFCSKPAEAETETCATHSPYLKPATGAKTEKIGNYRI